jgi:hypothetical protein
VDQPEPRIAPPSLLHRRLRVTPGRVPSLICATTCEGFDVFVPLLGFPLFFWLCNLLAGTSRWPLPWMIAIPIVCGLGFAFYLPFQDRERFGRARRRRGECVWCGQANVASKTVCPRCEKTS